MNLIEYLTNNFAPNTRWPLLTMHDIHVGDRVVVVSLDELNGRYGVVCEIAVNSLWAVRLDGDERLTSLVPSELRRVSAAEAELYIMPRSTITDGHTRPLMRCALCGADNGYVLADADNLRSDRDRHASMLLNLLARIHRDGGQYVEQHGIEKAAADGDGTVASLLAAAEAALRYDAAIQVCANDPGSMASFCSAEGDDLDTLYEDWISAARAALEARK